MRVATKHENEAGKRQPSRILLQRKYPVLTKSDTRSSNLSGRLPFTEARTRARIRMRIDTDRLLAAGSLQQKPSKYAGARADVDNTLRAEVANRRSQKVELGSVA